MLIINPQANPHPLASVVLPFENPRQRPDPVDIAEAKDVRQFQFRNNLFSVGEVVMFGIFAGLSFAVALTYLPKFPFLSP